MGMQDVLRRGPVPRGMLLGAALLALLLVVAGLTVAVALSSWRPSAVEFARPPVAGFVASGPVYESLPELATKSELIVVGTVTESVIGEVVNDDPEFPSRFVHTVVHVEEPLKGSAPRVVTVVTHELAFRMSNTQDWRRPGERVLLFLTRSTETPGLHILANSNLSQTAYLMRGEDLEATVREPDYPLSDRVAALSLSELRTAVRGTQ